MKMRRGGTSPSYEADLAVSIPELSPVTSVYLSLDPFLRGLFGDASGGPNPATSPLSAASLRLGRKNGSAPLEGAWESICRSTPAPEPGPSHVAVHVVIRGFETVRNRSCRLRYAVKRSQSRRNGSRWTRLPRFRDREAPGSNPGPPTNSTPLSKPSQAQGPCHMRFVGAWTALSVRTTVSALDHVGLERVSNGRPVNIDGARPKVCRAHF